MCLFVFPRQASAAHFSLKDFTSKQVPRLDEEWPLCVFVVRLHCDVLFSIQKNFGASTLELQSAIIIIASVSYSASGVHKLQLI